MTWALVLGAILISSGSWAIGYTMGWKHGWEGSPRRGPVRAWRSPGAAFRRAAALSMTEDNIAALRNKAERPS